MSATDCPAAPTPPAAAEAELEIRNLEVSFRTAKGLVHAVRGITMTLHKGETLAIVGESGSGKSVTAKAVLGIEAPNAVINSGEIIYRGQNLLAFTEAQYNKIRGNKITMVFQDPLSSLDPIVKVGPQMTEATILNGRTNQRIASRELRQELARLRRELPAASFAPLKSRVAAAVRAYRAYFKEQDAAGNLDADFFAAAQTAPDFLAAQDALPPQADAARLKELAQKKAFRVTRRMAYAKALGIMREVGITEPEKRFHQYPFEFSGGMRQRIVIAIAIAANPDLLICDEPTTALDVTIQAQILELINRLKAQRRMSVIFITHDLGVVANVADRIAVMYAGKVVETGTAEDIFYRPAHPYTWALLSSMPDLDTKDALDAIPGTPPNMLHPPAGDAFAPRNQYAMAIDFEQEPPLFQISGTHAAATWLLHPDAPSVEPPRAVTERIARMRARQQEPAHAE